MVKFETKNDGMSTPPCIVVAWGYTWCMFVAIGGIHIDAWAQFIYYSHNFVLWELRAFFYWILRVPSLIYITMYFPSVDRFSCRFAKGGISEQELRIVLAKFI